MGRKQPNPPFVLFLIVAILTFLIVFPRIFAIPLYADERVFADLIALLVSHASFGVRAQVFDWLAFLLAILIWNHYRKFRL